MRMRCEFEFALPALLWILNLEQIMSDTRELSTRAQPCGWDSSVRNSKFPICWRLRLRIERTGSGMSQTCADSKDWPFRRIRSPRRIDWSNTVHGWSVTGPQATYRPVNFRPVPIAAKKARAMSPRQQHHHYHQFSLRCATKNAEWSLEHTLGPTDWITTSRDTIQARWNTDATALMLARKKSERHRNHFFDSFLREPTQNTTRPSEFWLPRPNSRPAFEDATCT
jgi:hypothetical protein